MAETITLRAYLDDVKRLLDRGATTEAISHCRYILQHYPRNVETYRLLAQALLQKAQDQGSGTLLGEAAEVFQRVLGVVPGDHVAHIGLSEIRESEGRLDQAIWHLERAYEQLPGNPMLQEGLRALYAKRDGDSRVPAKIHLTRGALARQYVNGQLYDQALIELRHALEQNPARLDLQMMLAETLMESQHVVEAGEVALQILKKLPNCLSANRIMARLWLDNERPSDAQMFLARVEALDPYAAAQVLQPSTNLPDPNRIPRLDYGSEVQAALSQATPDWVQDLGAVDIGAVFQTPPAAPARGEGRSAPVDDVRPSAAPDDNAMSFDWFLGQSEAADEAPSDWFSTTDRDEPNASAAASPASGADWLNDVPSAPEEGLPDWFTELAEPAELFPDSASQPALEADWLLGDDEFEIPGDLPAETPVSDLTEITPPPADWMTDLDALEAEELELPAAEAGEVPDWLGGAVPRQEEGTSGDLDWLAVNDTVPDILLSEAENEIAPPEPAPSAPTEDWLADLGDVDITSFEVGDEGTAAELDWSADETEVPPALDEILGEPELEAQDEAAEIAFSEDLPSSGFTEILAGIEPWSMKPDQEEMTEKEEPLVTPPEWLAAYTEDDLVGELGPEESLLSAESQKALLGEEDSRSWEETQEELASASDALFSAGNEDKPVPDEIPAEDDILFQQEPLSESEVPDWLTEPENDFFALASEQSGELLPSAEDTLRAELMADTDDWIDEQAADEPTPADVPEAAQESRALMEDGVEADWLAEQPAADTGSHDLRGSPDVPQQTDELELGGWLDADAGAALELEEPADEAELDWLQPQAAEIDWLSSFARPEEETPELDLLEPEPALSFSADEEPEAQAEWEPAAMEQTPAEWAAPEEELPGSALEEKLSSDDSTSLAEAIETGEESPVETGETPAWMAELQPVSPDDAPVGQVSNLFDQPYDPFEGGDADKAPEYHSARETGILQPDESPDWMAAFGDEEVPDETEPAVELEMDDQEAFLAALGIETPDEPAEALLQEPETAAATDTPDDFAAQAEDHASELAAEEEFAPAAEDTGAMPDWLAAITTSASHQFGDMFEDEASYSPSAEASGVVSESELDWLEPLGEGEFAADESAGKPLDLDAIFGATESPETAPEDWVADDAEVERAAQDFGDLSSLRETLASEEEFAQPTEADTFEFEFGEMQVAPTDNITDTKDMEENDAPWLDDESEDDESVPDDFSFEEIVPRWLREPKDSKPWASARQDEQPQTPNWLRDVFDDEESDE